ncbi:hypothetical protein BDV32DRAFT_59702 [Aspergillus pseudonomiae]|uniref:NmrA-like domain-containing protein n=1 Tax=Aspergillus pseudonomiae TaxID=1506151 RepID=A0A5N6HXP6_9EURO|nr:uncharacterized protein BDV37DRAFT_246212 [Aspergillus pseudonomiae]KAB8259241.1 hypothetical protein BDV32DRAFT_59702 [Aspergillus pseudonomiae]KAE8404991.1 hypothetical protein BDV37DRAFT_246212 [Aspergillus pseudonomiae]
MTIALLIIGATGKQGGAVVDALVAQDADVEILAVTRNAQSPSAQKLAQKSDKVKLVQGDLNNPAGIFENAKKASSLPVWGVFSLQSPFAKGESLESEERQGKALIDEAIKQRVQHFVQTSVDRGGDASTDNPTNVPHFVTKYNIEQYLFEKTKDGSMDWTVLRPVFFFDNLTPDFIGKVTFTAWDAYIQGKPLQCIATSDIGIIAAKVLLQHDRFKNQCLSLAGDELTFDQMAKKFKTQTGHSVPTTFRFVAYFIMMMAKDLRLMFKWFHNQGYGADIKQIKQIHPGLKDFDTWLKDESQFLKH